MATTKMGKDAAPEPKAPTPPEPPEPAADTDVLSKDIDTRMAALLKDHQAMGARPK